MPEIKPVLSGDWQDFSGFRKKQPSLLPSQVNSGVSGRDIRAREKAEWCPDNHYGHGEHDNWGQHRFFEVAPSYIHYVLLKKRDQDMYPESSIDPNPQIFYDDYGLVSVKSDERGYGGWKLVHGSAIIWGR